MARKTPKQRLALVFSLVMFGSSGLMGAIRLYGTATAQMAAPAMQPTAEPTELSQQLKGYQQVLSREPNNQTAIEGLAQTQLQMGDFKGAIAPLEKLVKLNPDRSDYAALLAQAKQQVKLP